MIATEMVMAHCSGMTTKPEAMLSKNLASEMRPERIGHRMMLLREANNLRPAEMADLLGIERTYWSRFENGKRAISETVAALLVEKFGVTLDFLILGRWEGLPLSLAEKMRALDRKNN